MPPSALNDRPRWCFFANSLVNSCFNWSTETPPTINCCPVKHCPSEWLSLYMTTGVSDMSNSGMDVVIIVIAGCYASEWCTRMETHTFTNQLRIMFQSISHTNSLLYLFSSKVPQYFRVVQKQDRSSWMPIHFPKISRNIRQRSLSLSLFHISITR